MTKTSAVDWGGLFKVENPALQWIILCIVYLISNILVQGYGHLAFTYTMVYTLAFLLIAITISKSVSKGKDAEIGTLFGIMTLFVGLLAVVTSMAWINPQTGMFLAIVFTILAFLNEYGVVESKYSPNNKYCVLAALGGIFLFGLTYFLGRLGYLPGGWPPSYWVGPLPWYTIINHLGILLLAGADMVLLMGVGKWEKARTVRWLFFGLALIGAVAMLYYDFGLAML